MGRWPKKTDLYSLNSPAPQTSRENSWTSSTPTRGKGIRYAYMPVDTKIDDIKRVSN